MECECHKKRLKKKDSLSSISVKIWTPNQRASFFVVWIYGSDCYACYRSTAISNSMKNQLCSFIWRQNWNHKTTNYYFLFVFTLPFAPAPLPFDWRVLQWNFGRELRNVLHAKFHSIDKLTGYWRMNDRWQLIANGMAKSLHEARVVLHSKEPWMMRTFLYSAHSTFAEFMFIFFYLSIFNHRIAMEMDKKYMKSHLRRNCYV